MNDGLLNASDSAYLREQAYNTIIGNRFSSAVDQLQPKIFPDGDKWCALYGKNIQEGVAGFGDTPAKALSDWDNNFWNQKLKTS